MRQLTPPQQGWQNTDQNYIFAHKKRFKYFILNHYKSTNIGRDDKIKRFFFFFFFLVYASYILRRSDTILLLEIFGEIFRMRKTCTICNFGYRASFLQHLTRFSQSVNPQVINGGFTNNALNFLNRFALLTCKSAQKLSIE